TRPMFRAGKGLNFRYDTGSNQSQILNNSTTIIPRQPSSGAMLCSPAGAHFLSIVDFGAGLGGYALFGNKFIEVHTGGSLDDATTLVYNSRRLVFGWRSNGTNFTWYLNGLTENHAALTTANQTNLYYGASAGNAFVPIRIFESINYSTDIGDANMKTLL